MIFRQLFDQESSTYTYLLGDTATGAAALVDPVLEQADRDLALVQELGLRLTHVLETHVHADHVTAAGLLRQRTGCRTVGSPSGAACTDLSVQDGDIIHIGGLEARVIATPGHTDDSLTYHIGDKLFTGDALLIRTCGRTDFQNGDAGALFDAIHGRLFTLPDSTHVYPGHDYKGRTVSTIGEEKQHNARLAGRTRDDFISLMAGLNLPPPKKLDQAVPANRACGQAAQPTETASVVNISVHELAQLRHVRRVDVREPDEYTGPLGHLADSELIPMAGFPAAAQGWPTEAPVLLICRSGNRSMRVGQALAQSGFRRLYNLEGGMLAVNAAHLPVEGQSS